MERRCNEIFDECLDDNECKADYTIVSNCLVDDFGNIVNSDDNWETCMLAETHTDLLNDYSRCIAQCYGVKNVDVNDMIDDGADNTLQNTHANIITFSLMLLAAMMMFI